MEILNLLETKIQDMLEEIKQLKAENNKLREDIAVYSELAEENSGLQLSLNTEKKLREETSQRINLLLEKINSELN